MSQTAIEWISLGIAGEELPTIRSLAPGSRLGSGVDSHIGFKPPVAHQPQPNISTSLDTVKTLASMNYKKHCECICG